MAQEIMVAGAIYEDVPSVRLPDSNGVFHPFTDTSDTTAVAADVAQGKTFHLADGSAATGTASGGGGASNVVAGTFMASLTGKTTITSVDVPYTGSGYPVFVAVYVHGGINDPSNTGWYNVAKQYKVGIWAAAKTDPSAPSDGQAEFSTVYLYKSGTSPWNTYAYDGQVDYVYHEGGDPSAANASLGKAALVVVMDGPSTLKAICSSSNNNYSLQKNTEYDYVIVYSE